MPVNPSYRSPLAAKALVAALVPVVLAVASFVSTGVVDWPESVLLISSVVTGLFVYLVPNTALLTTLKAIVAGLTPFVIAIVSHAPLSDVVRIGEPLLSAFLVWATSNAATAPYDQGP